MELRKEWKAWKAFKAAGKELEAVGKEKELEAVSNGSRKSKEEISAENYREYNNLSSSGRGHRGSPQADGGHGNGTMEKN